MISLLHSNVSDQFVNEKMYKAYMKNLQNDPVPNIRFNYAKTVPLLYKKMSNSNKMNASDALKRLAESDPDQDVKFYAAKALAEISKK